MAKQTHTGVGPRFTTGAASNRNSAASRKAIISSAKSITDMINAFLNEMELALLQDVKDFHDQDLITDAVYNAFVNRDMTLLDELYKDDLEATRIAQLTEQSKLRAAKTGDNFRFTKWKGTNFKANLRNDQFKHSNSVAKKIPPVLILGSPGIGKSDIIRSIANSRKYGKEGMIDIRLSQKESIDLRGFPVPNDATRSVEWFISSEWPRNPLSRGILFFDELTSAAKSVQVAAYEIILDRKLGDVQYGGYELPPGWLICAAGNLKDDDAAVEDISSALANRMMHLILEVDVRAWTDWAYKNNVHPAIISYINSNTTFHGLAARYKLHCLNATNGAKFQGVLLPVVDRERGWPSPRSWTRASNILHTYENIKYLIGSQSSHQLSKYYNKILEPMQVISMASEHSPFLNQEALEDMIVGLIGFDLGYDFLNFYFSYQKSVNLAIEIALLDLTASNYSEIDNHNVYPVWTVEAIKKRDPKFQKIQQTKIKELDGMTVAEFVRKLNDVFATDITGGYIDSDEASRLIAERDAQVIALRKIIGGEPLAFLQSMPSILKSENFRRIASDRAKLDNNKTDEWQQVFRFCIRNIVELCSGFQQASQAFSQMFVNAMISVVSSLKATSDTDKAFIQALSKVIKNSTDRARIELEALSQSNAFSTGIDPSTLFNKTPNVNLSFMNQNTNQKINNNTSAPVNNLINNKSSSTGNKSTERGSALRGKSLNRMRTKKTDDDMNT